MAMQTSVTNTNCIGHTTGHRADLAAAGRSWPVRRALPLAVSVLAVVAVGIFSAPATATASGTPGSLVSWGLR